MDLLRFITAGSVDDGKSTLIGRLLYDSKSVFQDQLDAIERAGQVNGEINLALLTDGLKAEREQGITIDIAYKYFSTPKRKFIIADAPGHVQYTRNMVTGASNSDLAIILIDARKGVIEQTYRHSYIVSLLRIPYVVVCINKMDLVDFSETRFEEIKNQYTEFAKDLGLESIEFIPISALRGDNVVDPSTDMGWWKGNTLLGYLEEVEILSDEKTPAAIPCSICNSSANKRTSRLQRLCGTNPQWKFQKRRSNHGSPERFKIQNQIHRYVCRFH